MGISDEEFQAFPLILVVNHRMSFVLTSAFFNTAEADCELVLVVHFVPTQEDKSNTTMKRFNLFIKCFVCNFFVNPL